MKKKLFLIYVGLLTAGFTYAQTALQSVPLDRVAPISQLASLDNSVQLRYCTDNLDLSLGAGASKDVEVAIFIPKEIAKKYAGNRLTKIMVGFGQSSATNGSVVIRNSLTGNALYTQDVTFATSQWNTIPLGTAYTIQANEDLYIGYTYRGGTGTNFYSIGLDDSPSADANGDLIRTKASTSSTWSSWDHLGQQGFSNLCIIGIVEGDQLPQEDVNFNSLSVPFSALDVNEALTINGSVLNVAVNPVTSLEISYQIGTNAKVTKTFTDLNIPANGSYNFTFPDITFAKVAGEQYPLVVAVEKVNGKADEDPSDNTQTAVIKAWKAPTQPTMLTTDPSNKNVVIEEYTGIYCTYCPDGHKRVNTIIAAYPERVVAVNVHQGGYAWPNTGDPDFRTQWGDALAAQTGLEGYPAATVNRHVFSGGATATSDRGKWTTYATQIMKESSYVNMAVKANINEAERILTVDVEMYYTAQGSAVNRLNVALLQDSIIGPQTGASSYYPAMGNNQKYQHNHMLRDFLTGQWGDVISTTAAGTFVTKRYTYVIPADYRSIPVNLNKLEVVAYVAEGKQEIITGASDRWAKEIVDDGLSDLRISPVSASIQNDLLTIHSSLPVQNIAIYTISGQQVIASQTLIDNQIPVNQLNAGIYIVKVKTPEGEKAIKVVK
ncbi:MAG: Omp28-related outer membrane protein [Dysgonamonadaceae bacterium]|jgi:hypothetical protein|nr:Omp28-related outer membrane protein [Dysgonamonadaceae bacterium]